MQWGLRRRCVAAVTIAAAMLACAPTHAGIPPAPQDQPSASQADVFVTDLNKPAALHLGQTLGVRPPGAATEWQVDYDEDALRMLTPSGNVKAPGDKGWVWRATKAGRAEIVLTSKVRCATPPCPPNVMRFVIIVEIAP